MSFEDPYPEFPNVIDLHTWKKNREIEDEEDLEKSLGYFRDLLEEIVGELNINPRTFHLPSDRDYLTSLTGSHWDDLEEFEWIKYDGDHYDDEEDDEDR